MDMGTLESIAAIIIGVIILIIILAIVVFRIKALAPIIVGFYFSILDIWEDKR